MKTFYTLDEEEFDFDCSLSSNETPKEKPVRFGVIVVEFFFVVQVNSVDLTSFDH